MKGLNQCQRRWWKHVSPQRELEMQTSTENTAPDTQTSLCLVTDGAKRDRTRGQKPAEREKRGMERRTESLSSHLEAAHAITQTDGREMRGRGGRWERLTDEREREGGRRELGQTDVKLFQHI